MKDKLLNIWTIAAKDIREAFSNRLVISLMISALVMLVLPKWLGAMISPPVNEVLVYDPGGAGVTESLQENGFSVVAVKSEEDLISAVQRGVAVSGLSIPADFPQSAISGFISWSDRRQIPQLGADLQAALGTAVVIDLEHHLLYPGPGTFSMLGLSFLTMLVVMLIVGITLVPSLIFEEKQTKTLDALLVSPATEAQLVAAKALVGLFYTLLVALLLFGLNWNSVVHWELTVLFTLLCGLFSVSIGLVIGSLYERQQDTAGLNTALIILFVGGIFVGLVQLDVPAAVSAVLEWLPSTWLFHLLQNVFYQSYSWSELLPGLFNLIGITGLLFGAVVWKLRRSDR
jgi:ABC-2 type transport system permease protein